MNTDKQTEWPTEFGFSMAPFGYTVTVLRTALLPYRVEYTCRREGCAREPFICAFDPRDCSIEAARDLVRLHVDQEH
jgi:hypothetical protein